MSTQLEIKSVTVPWVIRQKGSRKISMLTAYDYPMALLVDQAGTDLILVGDSVATTIYGEPNTLSMTMEQMLLHTRLVSKAAQRALVVGDMPFMSYQASSEDAVKNAGRFLQEGRAQAVKLEGGTEVVDRVRTIVKAGVPVMGHIGLTPQSIHSLGSYRKHGKTDREKLYLINSARALEEAGAFSIVLECIEEELAAEISRLLEVPTIGIGSGEHCDGQVLVSYDVLGLTPGKIPSFAKPIVDLKSEMSRAFETFVSRTQKEEFSRERRLKMKTAKSWSNEVCS